MSLRAVEHTVETNSDRANKTADCDDVIRTDDSRKFVPVLNDA